MDIPIFRFGTWYYSLDQVNQPGSGNGKLCMAPELLIMDDLRHIKDKAQSNLDVSARQTVLEDALNIFTNGRVTIDENDMQTAEKFQQIMYEQCGIPHNLTVKWSRLLLSYYKDSIASNNKNCSDICQDDKIVVVSLPSNTFTCLESCIDVLLNGSFLLIRPSRREPYSAARFVASLIQAGWPKNKIGYYPCTHHVLNSLIHRSDRAVVYGGDDTVNQYGHLSHVDVRGPGRSIAIIHRGSDINKIAASLLKLIASDSGRFCSNVSLIVEADNRNELAVNLSRLLDDVSVQDENYPLSHWPDAGMANKYRASIEKSLQPDDRVLTRRPIVLSLSGKTWLMPTLILLGKSPKHPLLKLEFPFPMVVVASFDKHSLNSMKSKSNYIYDINDEIISCTRR